MGTLNFHGGTVILEDRLLHGARVEVDGARIAAIRTNAEARSGESGASVDLEGGYLAPGFVDLHVQGGAGADSMGGTEEAFRTVCRAPARHGTTSLLPTTTVARHDQHLTFLGLCRRLKQDPASGARILGAHFY